MKIRFAIHQIEMKHIIVFNYYFVVYQIIWKWFIKTRSVEERSLPFRDQIWRAGFHFTLKGCEKLNPSMLTYKNNLFFFIWNCKCTTKFYYLLKTMYRKKMTIRRNPEWFNIYMELVRWAYSLLNLDKGQFCQANEILGC